MILRSAIRVLLLSCFAVVLAGQELQPRAYVPTPVGLNYFGVSYAYAAGALLFDPSLPVEDARVRANSGALAFGQTLSVLGRTAQALVVLPYAVANMDGIVSDAARHEYRSGLGDSTVRYAMNLSGAPAMGLREFATFRQKTLVGASLTVTIPTGQYDPNKLINIGTNRFGFKPEVGISRAIGPWIVEAAAGVWLYTSNSQYRGSAVRRQNLLQSYQAHFIRLLPRRSWAAFDWTHFRGGQSDVDGRPVGMELANTRLGATYSISLTPRQSLKISYFDGVISRGGADVRSIGISYNIVWLRGR